MTTIAKTTRATLAGLADDLLAAVARQAAAEAAFDANEATDDTTAVDLAIEEQKEAEATLAGAMEVTGVTAISRAGHVITRVSASIDGGLPEILQKFAIVAGPILKL